MEETTKVSPEQLIADYLAALRTAKGDSYADETRVKYLNGWFVVKHVNGEEKRYRKNQITFFTASLREEPFDGGAYERAKNEKLERQCQENQKRIDAKQRLEHWQKQNRVEQNQSEPVSSRSHKMILVGLIIVVAVAYLIGQSNLAEQRAIERAEKEAALKQEESERRAALQRERDMQDFLKKPLPTARTTSALDSEYVSALGRIRIGDALYWRDTHSLFGYIVDAESGFVWVADSYTVGGTKLRVYAKQYDRSYITKNFVIRK